MDEDSPPSSIRSLAKRLETTMVSGFEPMANGVVNELDAEFMVSVKSARTSIIEFYRPTCPYCQQMLAVLAELAEKYRSRVFFGKINTEAVISTIDQFDITGVPLTIAFKKGLPVSRVDGFLGFEAVDRWISAILHGVRPSEISGQISTI